MNELLGIQFGAATVEEVWGYHKKLKMELPYNPYALYNALYN